MFYPILTEIKCVFLFIGRNDGWANCHDWANCRLGEFSYWANWRVDGLTVNPNDVHHYLSLIYINILYMTQLCIWLNTTCSRVFFQVGSFWLISSISQAKLLTTKLINFWHILPFFQHVAAFFTLYLCAYFAIFVIQISGPISLRTLFNTELYGYTCDNSYA